MSEIKINKDNDHNNTKTRPETPSPSQNNKYTNGKCHDPKCIEKRKKL